jgi:arginyl-tRNA synthetase
MQEFTDKIAVAVKDIYGIDANVELTVPDESFGDYSTNIAMQLAPKLGKNPREIAGQIKDALNNDEAISGVEIAGPGFINIFLNRYSLALNWSLQASQIYLIDKVVIAEYSDPNAFKALHAGHLYHDFSCRRCDYQDMLSKRQALKVFRLNYRRRCWSYMLQSAMYGIIH